jgi:poly(3-hydroxybutyrate) depolymerase
MRNPIFYVMPIVLTTALFTSVFAYTVQGTVTNKADGKAVIDASVSLLKEGKFTKTDANGKFIIQGDDPASLQSQQGGGFINISQGILNYSQSGNAPVQFKIFDLVGNLVENQILYGSGSFDLRQGISAKGTYFARIRVGSATENIKFTTDGKHSSSHNTLTAKAAFKIETQGEILQVVADGFDTLKVPLINLDTTLTLTLNASAPKEEQFKFGYALKNTPTPSKGCGINSTLKATKNVENGQRFEMKVNGETRSFYMTLPKNYDNKKPYKVLFAMHCFGSNGEDFVHHTPDYDHPTPYYGQQVLDKENNYIFVSPDAVGGMWNKGRADHIFFDQMLTLIENNYCIDTSRVFLTGFSFGAMFSNSLAHYFQDRVRAVAVYAVADYNIWLPQDDHIEKKLPIAWMNVHGQKDGRCNYDRAKNSALVRILKNNGKADENGNFTDASAEKPQENEGNTGHVCYDFKTVDPRFPVKFCSWPGDHQWTAHDYGNMSVGWGWEQTWVPEEVHKFLEQF